MSRFIPTKIAFLLTVLLVLILLISCQPIPVADSQSPQKTPTATTFPLVASPDGELSTSPAKLPLLPYDYAALGKAIDAETMKIHHDGHHFSYVNNLNNALKQEPYLQKRTVEALLQNLNDVPEKIRTKVRNNGGGHLNHTIFWQIMSPEGGGEPTGEIATEINQTFGSFEEFKEQFNKAGSDRFGSGWVWLVRNPAGQLQIVTTANQDNPIMDGAYPIMGNDVWEHAYYLRYRNRRGEYLNNWWKVVNWPEINKRLLVSLQKGT
ncbi:superoxide dismutase [Umezakia ovalisporum]|uniref:superoxide dismutase n=2 Tax=Umezakia ovalisporum TaxID=75695 RepID=A0AA43KET1_9CYAN|nr:superoxide dismutase [Umezakia ovalisporum]MDH6055395.1 superoxide dismutase [Umezakia ovalisporum FSS-43]MDH6064124.1 superoxide dismutase [Umezakia ovalisporum FSS-62]MDH6066330.1 superoxide dismutase [Umezakia ovalisporum APH033B]MDH6071054.1 superoxide dismutase [Umezakia ovalisporum CobakiLakeA]MDH6075984.1 superoxide dismutase [Umezakia ovalisporum CS-1034]